MSYILGYIKALVTFLIVIASFFLGSLKSKNKRLEEEADKSEEEIENLKENAEIVKKVSNTNFSDFADSLFKRK